MIPHRTPGQKKYLKVMPKPLTITYDTFTGAYNTSDGAEDVKPGYSPGLVNMEVTKRDELIKAAGTRLVEDAGRSLRYAFVQASLDYSAELVAIDAPYVGYRGSTPFEWYDVSLPHGQGDWVAANVAGVLLFTDGDSNGYARQPNMPTIENLADMPPGRTVATAFGRIFVGAPKLSGIDQNLAISWNAASGDYSDWTGLGSGGELLISDLAEADKVVAMRPMGFDLLAILLRKSIWVGKPTGDAYRPADFQPRMSGVGCVAERTARVGLNGLYFLSDDGVYVFNGSTVKMISEPINGELLDLDYTRIREYSATFDSNSKRYILTTPVGTWVFDTVYGRWYFRTTLMDNVVSWSDQAQDPTWEEMVGAWEQQGSTVWSALVGSEQGTPAHTFFMKGTLLGVEDPSLYSNIGTSVLFAPYWQSGLESKKDMPSMIASHGFAVKYIGGGDLSFYTPDTSGNFAMRTEARLPQIDYFGVAWVPLVPVTGLNTGLMVVMGRGGMRISRLEQVVTPRSRRIGSVRQMPVLITQAGDLLVSTEGENFVARG